MPLDNGQLIVQLKGKVVRRLDLNEPVMTIGRAPDNQLTLEDAQVSRRHAEIRLERGSWTVIDLGSSNGTSVGETRLQAHQPHLLSPGASLQIGPFVLTYLAAEQRARADELPEQDLPAPPMPQEPEPALVPAVPAAPPASLPAITRPVLPVPLAAPQGSSYLYDLPIIFHDSDFLGRYLAIFESVWEPLEQRQDLLAMYFDSRTCPASFLPWLASWLDLAINAHWPEARRRRLLAEATEVYRWRGTRYGLARMIEICTGLAPDIDEGSEPFVFHIRLTIPPGSDVDGAFVEDLVRAHKPAHAGYILEVHS